MNIDLYPHQLRAIQQMKNGCILCGGVGTGKSRTALAYYYTRVIDGSLRCNGEGDWDHPRKPKDLYIITTAKKRDDMEWLGECALFGLSDDTSISESGIKVTVDSWNNIKKYTKVVSAFFIFDEQRVVGKGAWVKAFLKIAKKNQWILLSATPGDKWEDYIPVFVANGFYKNRTDFVNQHLHIVYKPHTNYPTVAGYMNTGTLLVRRRSILVNMKFQKDTHPNHYYISCNYDKTLYKRVWRDRWDPYDNQPIAETGKLCYLLRKVVNSDASRFEELRQILSERRRAIIFYNYTYELEGIRSVCNDLGIPTGEWNGSVHSDIPKGKQWAYIVQYSAGSEGWNCVTTDTLIFFSQSYSYRSMVQAAGRIDRLNTPFKELYYYHFKSVAPIDLAISRALSQKKNFNERAFLG